MLSEKHYLHQTQKPFPVGGRAYTYLQCILLSYDLLIYLFQIAC